VHGGGSVGDAVGPTTGLSQLAYLALLVFRERERVFTTPGNLNVYAEAHSGRPRVFTGPKLNAVLIELEDAGLIRRTGSSWVLSST
jgi:hypothetical protein